LRNKRLWSALAFGLALAGIAVYLLTHREELDALSAVSWWQLAALVGLRCVFLAVNGLSLRACAAKFGVRLALVEWFGLSVVTTMGNYLTPLSGGLVARAVYLKRRHSLPYSAFAALLASNYLVTFWMVGAAGVGCAFAVPGASGLRWSVAGAFAAVVAAVSVLVALPAIRVPGRGRLSRVLSDALRGWSILKSDRRLLAQLAALTAVNIVAKALSFQVAYRALGVSLPFADALLIALLTALTIVVSITPGNLGVQEAVVGLTSGLLRGDVDQGVLASLLIRVATLGPAFGLGPLFSALLVRRSDSAHDDGLAVSKEGGDRVC
jgi:uncharacterized membrane protein YbhN (UPF0104 family)